MRGACDAEDTVRLSRPWRDPCELCSEGLPVGGGRNSRVLVYLTPACGAFVVPQAEVRLGDCADRHSQEKVRPA